MSRETTSLSLSSHYIILCRILKINGIFGYFQVFTGIFRYLQVFTGIFGYLLIVSVCIVSYMITFSFQVENIAFSFFWIEN